WYSSSGTQGSPMPPLWQPIARTPNPNVTAAAAHVFWLIGPGLPGGATKRLDKRGAWEIGGARDATRRAPTESTPASPNLARVPEFFDRIHQSVPGPMRQDRCCGAVRHAASRSAA